MCIHESNNDEKSQIIMRGRGGISPHAIVRHGNSFQGIHSHTERNNIRNIDNA